MIAAELSDQVIALAMVVGFAMALVTVAGLCCAVYAARLEIADRLEQRRARAARLAAHEDRYQERRARRHARPQLTIHREARR